jgi:hypothetical protein
LRQSVAQAKQLFEIAAIVGPDDELFDLDPLDAARRGGRINERPPAPGSSPSHAQLDPFRLRYGPRTAKPSLLLGHSIGRWSAGTVRSAPL